MSTEGGGGVHFIPADPTPRLPRLEDQSGSFLCWVGPATIIAVARAGLVVESLPTGRSEHLSTVHATVVEDVAPALMAALAAHLRTSTARPDHGPRPVWSARLLVLLAATLATLVSLAWSPARGRLRI